MIQFPFIFTNWFNRKDITLERLVIFAKDFRKRLMSNNTGGIYDALIAGLQTFIDNATQALQGKGSELGDRKGSATGKKATRKDLQKYISQNEGLVRSKFDKDTKEYKEIFPQGVSAFRKATDEHFTNLTGTLVQKATKYVAQLGTDFKDNLILKRTAFLDAEDTLGGDKGDVDSENIQILQARHALEIGLVAGILQVALNNIDGPAEIIATTYLDEHLLFPEHTTQIFKGDPPPHSVEVVCSFVYHATNHFDIEHKSAEELKWRMKLNDVFVGNEFVTHLGDKLHKAFSDFAPDGDTLVCINDGDVAGKYRVTETS